MRPRVLPPDEWVELVSAVRSRCCQYLPNTSLSAWVNIIHSFGHRIDRGLRDCPVCVSKKCVENLRQIAATPLSILADLHAKGTAQVEAQARAKAQINHAKEVERGQLKRQLTDGFRLTGLPGHKSQVKLLTDDIQSGNLTLEQARLELAGWINGT